MGNTSSDLLDQQWTINTLDLLARAIRATKYGNEPAEKWQKLLEERTIEISTCLTNLLDTLQLGIASPKTSFKHKMSVTPQKFILKTNDDSHIQLIGDVKARNLNNFSIDICEYRLWICDSEPSNYLRGERNQIETQLYQSIGNRLYN